MQMSLAPELSVNVRELMRAPAAHRHVHLEHALDDVRTPVAAVDPDVPAVVDVEIENVVDGLLVTGQVTADVRAECVRCLTGVTEHVTVGVQELFARSPGEADDGESGYAVLDGDTLPLDTMVRDALVLAFPAQPRCRSDCAGLCPVCGADQNETTCDHEAAADPRWLPLAGLRSLNDNDDTNEEGQDARPEA
jgi:uncharacterized protein